MTVSITVHVFSIWGTVRLKYSFTNQNPPSFTCERINEPAPIAMINSSRGTPGVPAAIGATIPAAMVIATVAEPDATRIHDATRQPSHIGERIAPRASMAIAL